MDWKIDRELTGRCSFLTAKPSADDLEDAEAFEGDNFTWAVPCDGSPKGSCALAENGFSSFPEK